MLIRDNKISKRQVRLLLILQMFSTPILMLPKVMAQNVMHDGWLIPVLGAIIAYIYAIVITGVTQRFPNQTIVEFAPSLLTKPIGIFIIIIFGIKILITTAFELRLLSEIVKQLLLPRTPTGVIMMVMLFTVAYLICAGIEPYARMGEILVFAVFIPLVVVFAFIVARADYRQLLPVFQSSKSDIIRATYYVSLTFMPLEFMLLFTAFMRKPDSARDACKGAIITVFIIETVTVLLTYIGVGVGETRRNFWPVLTLMQSVQFPGAFIENQEIAMISCWILSIFVYISGGVYACSLISARILGLKKDNLFVLPYIPIIYILAMIPSSFIEVYEWSFMFRFYFGAVFLLPIPLILLLLSIIKKEGASPYEKV